MCIYGRIPTDYFIPQAYSKRWPLMESGGAASQLLLDVDDFETTSPCPRFSEYKKIARFLDCFASQSNSSWPIEDLYVSASNFLGFLESYKIHIVDFLPLL